MGRSMSARALGGVAASLLSLALLVTAANVDQTEKARPSSTPAPAASAAAVSSASPVSILPTTATPVVSEQPLSTADPSFLGVRPGAVNATSMNLTATYESTVRMSFATRAFGVNEAIRITNTSGIAIDRLEL